MNNNTTTNKMIDGMVKRLRENTGMDLDWERVPDRIFNLFDKSGGGHHTIKTVIGKTAFYDTIHGMSCIIEEMRAAKKEIPA